MAESVKSNSSTCDQDDESYESGEDEYYEDDYGDYYEGGDDESLEDGDDKSYDYVLYTDQGTLCPLQETPVEDPSQVGPLGIHISLLPPELLTAIFRHLDELDLCRATRVCCAWRHIAYHSTMLRNTVVTLKKNLKYSEKLFPSLARRGVKSLHILNMNVLRLKSQHRFLLRELSNVTDLSLFKAKQVTDFSINIITQHLKNLVRLNLRDCEGLTNHSLMNIAKGLRRLTWLDMGGCNSLSDIGVKCLSVRDDPRLEEVPVLEFLGLRGRGNGYYITDNSLLYLSRGQANLVELDLSCRIELTNEGMIHLTKMNKLSKLSLAHTNIGTAGLAHLSKRGSNITQLDLTDCRNLTNAGLEHVGRMTHLLDLNLSGCSIGAENLELLVKFGSKIQVLDLTRFKNMLDDAIKHVAKLKNLRELRLDLGNEGFGRLAAAGSQVSILNGQVTDVGLQHMAKLTNLRQLTLNEGKFTCEGLLVFMDSVAETMTHLKLSSYFSSSLNPRILLYVAQRLFNLETLELSNGLMDDEGKAAAARNLPRLRRFMVNNENIIDDVRSFGHPERIM